MIFIDKTIIKVIRKKLQKKNAINVLKITTLSIN